MKYSEFRKHELFEEALADLDWGYICYELDLCKSQHTAKIGFYLLNHFDAMIENIEDEQTPDHE